MTYDISFTPREGTEPPSLDALRAWFSARDPWRWFEGGAAYMHPDTGTQMTIHARGEPFSLALSMAGDAAHVAGIELVDEVSALVARFSLDVDDPQMEGMGRGPLDAERLRAGFDFFNAFATRTQHALLGRPIPTHASAAELEAASAWNRARRRAPQDDACFVPSIAFHRGDDGSARTFVAWTGGVGRLPIVDDIVHPLRTVPFASVANALEKAGASIVALPAPHYDVDRSRAAVVEDAIASSATTRSLPVIVPAHSVRTTEVLAPYLAPDPLDSLDVDTLVSKAGLAHLSGDASTAFDVASRAMAKDPRSSNAATLAAINAHYLAEYDEALRCADTLLAIRPTDVTGHIVRCGALTELARYDEAVNAAETALTLGGPSAMVENMRADALAASGHTGAAHLAYERAIEIIDAELVKRPSDGDVLSRKAYALIGLGRPAEALAVAERALELVSEPLLTLQTIGRAELAAGRVERAIEALERIDRNRRASPLAAFHLAVAYAKSGRGDEARGVLSDALASEHYARRVAEEPVLRALDA